MPPRIASLELVVDADPSALSTVRKVAAAFARAVGMRDDSVEAVALAVNEAASNSILHGYRQADQGTLQLAASLAGSTLAITLSDNGAGDQTEARRGDEVGRGLPLMRALSERVEVSRGERGTRVLLTFPVAS